MMLSLLPNSTTSTPSDQKVLTHQCRGKIHFLRLLLNEKENASLALPSPLLLL